MRNVLEGSNMVRGRKNRTNIRKQVVRKPATLAQTIRRLILLTGGSGVLSTTAPGALDTGFAAGGVVGFTGGGGAGEPFGAGGAALSGHKSRLAVLSTMRTSGDLISGSTSTYDRWVHFHYAVEGELYNSPHSRDRSLRSGSNYFPKH